MRVNLNRGACPGGCGIWEENMVSKVEIPSSGDGQKLERIAFTQQMLIQLSQVARADQEDMLSYLIDMAYEEASDIIKRMR